MSKLVLSSKLSLPIDAVTQTIGILAKRRAGKSYTARRFVEQLVKAKQQVCIVDPKGDWWGIRSAVDGESPGLPITILGGERGDVPLEVGAGEVIAKLVAEERVSVLLDLSLFRKHEVSTFMGSFLENLYRIKAREEFRTALMLIIDEADAIAPQKPYKGEERMLGATEDIVRRGGQRGIGCLMITQRSAVLNKNVLTQIQVLIVLRTIAPQDLAALNAWIDVHGTAEQRATLMESLASLPTGDAWVWSPGWPTVDGIFQRVTVCPIATFDSGATPKPGEKRKEPKNVADVDLEALRKTMAATIERAKADDPKLLRKRIREIEAEAAKKDRAGQAVVEKSNTLIKTREVPVLKDGQIARLEKFAERMEKLLITQRDHFSKTWSDGVAVLMPIFEGLKKTSNVQRPMSNDSRPQTISRPQVGPTATPAFGGRQSVAPAGGDSSNDGQAPSGGLRRILVALAQRPQGLTSRQIGVRAGLSSKGGTFTTYLSRARTNGWIEGDRSGIRVTQAGIDALGSFDPLPTGQALLDHWLGEFGGSGAAKILRELAAVYPNSLTKAEVAERAGISAAGGTFSTYVSRLRSLELVQGKSELKASDEFFE